MSIPVTSNTMSNLLDNSHKITEDLQHWFESYQAPQLKLCYANISYLPKSETIQKLEENSPPKPCHAKITYHGGKYTKTFQEHINQSLKQQNPFSERKTIRNSI
ncbi:hypothetical protein RHABOEDO_000868 [Candidatus Rhabdochlamydia oedothoracis]|uniref:Uncharacterized protein n=1 Tax=Candidatus Rhabdochlamydia oedothoracis TaxID=2720720 RepID=A0ABX8V0I4_9BACT|nr:hypothetical protein [Candidatus Rhabdochlamydia sp. W815]KAG6559783.1 hypothetical protein RHOW815_000182 [Candidatus Rhabdochlamydia sp. W815]MCL6755668.1 hypothetical protein [Candidatus Rhabdochlamydia oedothoracis]QYF48666.1 hypothetical protein RHABOEDO_000868 [Candidatus Rhabdochlamydia oedothoracis]